MWSWWCQFVDHTLSGKAARVNILNVNLIMSLSYLKSINNPITSKVKSRILRWHTSVFIFSSLPVFPALSVTCVVSRTSQVPPHFGTGYRPHWPSRLPPTLLDSSQLLAPGILICHLEVSELPQCSPSTCCVLQLHIACLESFVYVSFSPLDCQCLWECQLYSLNLRLSIP